MDLENKKTKHYLDLKNNVIKEVDYILKEKNKITYENIDFFVGNEVEVIIHFSELLEICSTMDGYFLTEFQFESSNNLVDACKEILDRALRDDIHDYLSEKNIEISDD